MNTVIYLAALWAQEDSLQHHGVKGMHWGEHKAQDRLNRSMAERESGYKLADKYNKAMNNKVAKRQKMYDEAVANGKGKLRTNNAKDRLERAKQERDLGARISTKYKSAFDTNVSNREAKLAKVKARNEKINNGKAMKYLDATVTNAQIKKERKQAYKNRAKMSDQELRDMTNRINAEINLKKAINGSDSAVVSSYKKAVVGAVVATAINYTVRKVVTPQNLIRVLA